MKVEYRKMHRRLAPILFFPLLISAITGVAYSLGKNWLGMPNSLTNLLMTVHQGRYLGEKLVPIYVLLVGLGLIGMSVSGLMLLNRAHNHASSQQTQKTTRSIHRLIALIFLLPFAISAETGVLYQLGTDWFGMSREQTSVLLKIHQGAYLGSSLSVFYIVVIGLGLLTLLTTGIRMTSLARISIPQLQSEQNSPQNLTQEVASESHLAEAVNSVRKKALLGIGLFSLFFIVTLYSATSIVLSKYRSAISQQEPIQSTYHFLELLIPIVILALIVGGAALIIAEKLIQHWRRQKEIEASLYESEAASHTILKAVPDSMLRMGQDGTCLSYIPAKEAESFILQGDIVGKQVTNFLPLKVAQQLIKYADLTLKSGSTHTYKFTTTVDGGKQYQEARISAIGETEVLIMIREIADLEESYIDRSELTQANNNDLSVSVVSQPELIQLLEIILEDTKKYDKHHILCYLAIDQQETICEQHDSQAVNELLAQITAKVEVYLPYTCQIARLDSNELALLLRDYSLEQASILAEQLRQDLNKFSFHWHGHDYSITISIGVVEIDADSSDVISVMSAAEAACAIAKQKLTSKAFW